MIIYSELYSRLFSELAQSNRELDIISGYASPTFFRNVLSEFPHLKVRLFIGMSDEGISINSHLKYKEIQENSNSSIYYQSNKINGAQPNHIKAYKFSNGDASRVFIGSANFTENGFFNNREILTEISDNLSDLFEDQMVNSVSCLDPDITNFVTFTIAERMISNKFEESPLELPTLGKHRIKYPKLGGHNATDKFHLYRERIDTRYHKYFKVRIALNSTLNSRWTSTGINGALSSEPSVLKYSPEGYLYDLFPTNTIITLYTDDDKILKGRLVGNFGKDLALVDETWYDYAVNRLGIDFGIPLSNENLSQLKCASFEFERINESEYIMWLAE